MAFLVHEGAGHLALAQDVQEGLLGLTGGLGQRQALGNSGHETALNHVEDQHHPRCIARFT